MDVDPDLELVLPTGTISQRSRASFNRLDIQLQLSYVFLSGDSAGAVQLTLPFEKVTPGLSASYSLGFENLFAPRIQDGAVRLLPVERHISRQRAIDLSVVLQLFDDASLSTELELADLFRGDLQESSVLEQGVDLTPKMAFEYDTLKAVDPELGIRFRGTLFRSSVELPVRTSQWMPLYVHNESLLRVVLTEDPGWELEQELRLAVPWYLWEGGLSRFATLGGLDTVPGYAAASIPALWHALTRMALRSEPFASAGKNSGSLTLRLGDWQTRFHQLRLSLLFDLALAQDTLGGEAPLGVYPDFGLELSFVITAARFGHLSVRLLLAQAVQPAATPIFYLTTSLFSLKTRVGG